MSDYTPTTDDVRDYYAIGVDEALARTGGDSEFDRWLAAHDKEVLEKAAERAEATPIEDECGYCDEMKAMVVAAVRGDGAE